MPLQSTGTTQNGTSDTDILFGIEGIDSIQNGEDGNDFIIGDYGNIFTSPSGNNSIANAFSLDDSNLWYTVPNPLVFDNGVTPYTTVYLEGEGETEFFAVTVGAGETLTVDTDFNSFDSILEIFDASGVSLARNDDGAHPGDTQDNNPSDFILSSFVTYTNSSMTAQVLYIEVTDFHTISIPAGTESLLLVSVSNHAATGDPADFAAGNDVLDGGAGDDQLFGMDGDDTLEGGAGSDYLDGGDGNDTLSYAGSSAAVIVDLSADTVSGGDAEGDTILNFENITGSAFADTLTGDVGNNVIEGGAGADTLDGGDGVDTLSYAGSGVGVSVDLETNTVSGGDAEGDGIANFENITGSAFADTLTGDVGDNVIEGGAGDDLIEGGAGADMIDGGDGNDIIVAGGSDLSDGADIVNGGAGNDTITGGFFTDILNGDAGDDRFIFLENHFIDVIDGGADNDTLDFSGYLAIEPNGFVYDWVVDLSAGTYTRNVSETSQTIQNVENVEAGDGNDQLIGDANSNILSGGAGADTLDGGDGVDTLSYAGSGVGVSVDLETNTVSGGDAEGDGIANFENVTGSEFDDTIVIDGVLSANIVNAGGGDDIIQRNGDTGSAGIDSIDGGAGVNTLITTGLISSHTVDLLGGEILFDGASRDQLTNIQNVTVNSAAAVIGDAASNVIVGLGDHDNTFEGGAGDDLIEGGAGADTLDGGDGVDTLSYAGSTAGVRVNVFSNAASNGDAEGDIISNFENIIGSDFNDDLVASGLVAGGLGNDILQGGGLTYILDGGLGDDLIRVQSNAVTNGASFDGGDGVDEFVIFGPSATFDLRTDSITNIEILTLSVNAASEVIVLELNATQFANSGVTTVEIEGAHAGGGGQLSLFLDTETTLDLSQVTFTNFAEAGDLVQITGDADNETIIGSSVRDMVEGGDGDDIIEGGAGNDDIDGGDGIDTVNFSGVFDNYTLTENMDGSFTVTDNVGSEGTDTLTNIEFAQFGGGLVDLSDLPVDLTLTGTETGETLQGGLLNDTISGLGGNDILIGSQGADTLNGGSGDDTFQIDTNDIAVGAEFIDGGSETVGDRIQIFGAGGDIFDLRGSTLLSIEEIEFSINSSDGFRLLQIDSSQISAAGLADDLLIDGFDVVGSQEGIEVHLDTTSLDLSGWTFLDWGTTAFFPFDSEVINIFGSRFSDTITGSSERDVIEGANGNDVIVAGAGDDILIGGGGGDTLDGGDGVDTASYVGSTNRVEVSLLNGTGASGQATNDVLMNIENLLGSDFADEFRGTNGDNELDGGDGNDILIGFNGDDVLLGGAGRDIINGGDGADIIDGGEDADQARYNGSSEGVQIDLLNGTASGGQAEGDTLTGIESLFGSAHTDILAGDGENNRLFGFNGDDTLIGNGGVNRLNGGSGEDTFVLSDGFSFVVDFVDDVDQLDVSDYGFTTLSEALMNLEQVGAHARFRVGDDVLFVLNTDVDDLMDDIIFDDGSVV